MNSAVSVEADVALARQREPKVSLCIPAYQAELYLQATLDSVLAQDLRDVEIVVVDNNSSDGTADILRGTLGGQFYSPGFTLALPPRAFNALNEVVVTIAGDNPDVNPPRRDDLA